MYVNKGEIIMHKKIIVTLVVLVLLLSTVMCCSCDLIDSVSKKTVTVTLDPNGGNVSILTIKGNSGDQMELPTPQREGYDFAGWFNGYDVVSQTEFPKNDITLTARYYVKQDKDVSTIGQMDYNKEYKDCTYKFSRGFFDSPALVDYLKENHNVDVVIKVQVDAYIDGLSWLGVDGDLVVMGANKSDVLKKQTINNYSWRTYNFEFTTKSSYLYNADASTILHFTGSSSWGSTNLVFRNLKIQLIFTEKAGTLV